MTMMKIFAFILFAVSAIEASSFPTVCLQCESTENAFDTSCLNPISTRDIADHTKHCPIGKRFCSEKTVSSTDSNNQKRISVYRTCVRAPQEGGCRMINGSNVCSRTCEQNACNIKLKGLFPSPSSSNPSSFSPITSASSASSTNQTAPTSRLERRQCYFCDRTSSGDCAAGVQNAEIVNCPENQRCASVTTRFINITTAARRCTDLPRNHCYGGIDYGICITVCHGELCNNGPIRQLN